MKLFTRKYFGSNIESVNMMIANDGNTPIASAIAHPGIGLVINSKLFLINHQIVPTYLE